MDSGSAPINTSSDLPEVEERERQALRLIVGGLKKAKAFQQCKLPYKHGDRDYRRICRNAGKRIFFGYMNVHKNNVI